MQPAIHLTQIKVSGGIVFFLPQPARKIVVRRVKNRWPAVVLQIVIIISDTQAGLLPVIVGIDIRHEPDDFPALRRRPQGRPIDDSRISPDPYPVVSV